MNIPVPQRSSHLLWKMTLLERYQLSPSPHSCNQELQVGKSLQPGLVVVALKLELLRDR